MKLFLVCSGSPNPIAKAQRDLLAARGEVLFGHPSVDLQVPDHAGQSCWGESARANVTGTSGQAPIALLGVVGSIRAELFAKTWLQLGLSGGGVLAGFSGYGDGRPIAALQGLTVGARLGVARSF